MNKNNTDQLNKMIVNLQNRANNSVIFSTALGALTGFFGSMLVPNLSLLDNGVIGLVGLMLGRLFGTLKRNDLSERALIVQMQMDLLQHNLSETKPADKSSQLPEAVTNVQIPADPRLPEIPSIAAPAEVTQALKAAKAKTKPTRLPAKRKPKEEAAKK
jgi:hypothetical protein